MNGNENKYLDYSGLATLISEIQSRFPSNDNLKTVNGTSIIGSGNIPIRETKILTTESSISDLDFGTYVVGDDTTSIKILVNSSYPNCYISNARGFLIVGSTASSTRKSFWFFVYSGTVSRGYTSGSINNVLLFGDTNTTYFQQNQYVKFRDIVDTSSSQVISGTKSFSSLPISTLTPTSNDQLTPKKYVDNKVASKLDDVKVNGNSVASSGVANIVTKSEYDATDNKIVTENDLPDSYTKSETYNKQEVDAKIDEVTFNAISYDSTTETLIITSTIAGGNGEEY